MAQARWADRVAVNSVSTGTGDFALGPSLASYVDFQMGFGGDGPVFYGILDETTGQWEVGIGTLTSATLRRDIVLASSNDGAKVSFTAGDKTVYCPDPAAAKSNDMQSTPGSLLQVKRSGTAGWTPASGLPGELWVNFADQTFGYIDASGAPVTIAGSGYVRKTGDTMSGNLTIQSAAPYLRLYETDQTTGNRAWQFGASGGPLVLNTSADDGSGAVTRYRFERDGGLAAATSVLTRDGADTRYLGLAGGALTGDLEVGGGDIYIQSPGATTNAHLRFRNSAGTNQGILYWGYSDNTMRLRNYAADGTTVASEIVETLTAIQLNTGGTMRATIDSGGLDVVGALTVTTNATIGALLSVAGSVESGAGFYVNDDTTPSLYLRNAAKQVGAQIYTDGAGGGNFRVYESFASANYTGYAFRYGGPTNSGDVTRISDVDARAVNNNSVTNKATTTQSINGRINLYGAGRTDDLLMRMYGDADAIMATFYTDGRLTIASVLNAQGTSLKSNALQFGTTSTSYIDYVSGQTLLMRAGTTELYRFTADAALSTGGSVVTRTTGDARYMIASGTWNAVDTTMMARYTGTSDTDAGTTRTGSNLEPACATGASTGNTTAGTWVCTGKAIAGANDSRTTTWRRIS